MSSAVDNLCPKCRWPVGAGNWRGNVCKLCYMGPFLASGEEAMYETQRREVTTDESKLCPECAMLLPIDGPGGLCDRCHLEAQRKAEPDPLLTAYTDVRAEVNTLKIMYHTILKRLEALEHEQLR